jgi:uncharacterized membrane protein
MQYRTEFNSNSSSPFNSIIGILIGIFLMVGLFYLARFIFTILYYLSPIMLIAALIIDHKVVTGYIQWMGKLFKRNPLMGAGSVLLTLIGFPIVTAFLLGKAMFKKRIKEAQQEAQQAQEAQQGEFIDYEELNSEPLELPELEPEPRKKADNDYDQLFE